MIAVVSTHGFQFSMRLFQFQSQWISPKTHLRWQAAYKLLPSNSVLLKTPLQVRDLTPKSKVIRSILFVIAVAKRYKKNFYRYGFASISVDGMKLISGKIDKNLVSRLMQHHHGWMLVLRYRCR
jgi:hypothetical protein